ncbi:MAG: MBL fold metallo-hydrolase [Desulfobacteraceae bacterium]|nr:MBL fold metallo-hydrolase [Desulfobacteraceae bacterium]
MGKTGRIPSLKPATSVRITTLVDNYSDVFLKNSDHVLRPPMVKEGRRTPPLLAEHGLSFLIEVWDGQDHHAVIMDFGVSNLAMPHNLSALGVDPAEMESFVLSHGHHDHIGALKSVLGSLPHSAEVFVHPHAFLKERIHSFSDGSEVPIPSLKKEDVEATGSSIIEVTEPTLLAGGYMLTLTEIPRQVDFEKGMPTTYYKKEGQLYKDHIRDDQGLAILVRNKGLVVITGCGHSGIINTLFYARQITGSDKIHAVMGGFHLTGPHFEPVIASTVQEMKKFSPEVLVPCHCTGYKAIRAFEREFPEAFVLNAVGTIIEL